MSETTEKKGMSTGAKWGVGCGIGCLTIVIILAIAGFIGYKFAKGKLDEMQVELKQHGFETVIQGQNMELRDDITEPAIYMGQIVKIMGDCHTDLAIMAQLAEIHGTVSGDVYFRGQVLTIQPNAIITGNLDLKAQAVQKYGTVQGEITGIYQIME
jgi:hypothetical protein